MSLACTRQSESVPCISMGELRHRPGPRFCSLHSLQAEGGRRGSLTAPPMPGPGRSAQSVTSLVSTAALAQRNDWLGLLWPVSGRAGVQSCGSSSKFRLQPCGSPALAQKHPSPENSSAPGPLEASGSLDLHSKQGGPCPPAGPSRRSPGNA